MRLFATVMLCFALGSAVGSIINGKWPLAVGMIIVALIWAYALSTELEKRR